MFFNPNDYPIVFLSYDEPNADKNFKHLQSIKNDVKRVHGIKGSDTAHKKVASIANSDRVIIVDGDNFVNINFFNQNYNLGDIDYKNSVISFTAHNIINGQQYGNGGIKSWPTKLLQSMNTHENSNASNTVVDFDFSYYKQFNYIASELHINASPLQAWRAGFREGVKLLLDDGLYKRDLLTIDWRNYDRLWNWMHIGSDIKNGIYAIHGARFGCWYALRKLSLKKIHDFDYLNYLFDYYNKVNINDDCERIGSFIKTLGKDDRITRVYSPQDSKRYRETVKPILRSPNNDPYDIVFISYDEKFAEENFNKLKSKFPRAKRIHGIKGIHQAHIEAAKLCTTDYFFVVDADAEIVDDFKFDYLVPFYDTLKVRVWRAKNPINGLIYGYGGIKLLPRIATVRMRTDKPDMTTSICDQYEPIFELSNITKFDTDPFNTWKSAFRECVKLSSQIIDRQVSEETLQRLEIWCSVGDNRYCLDGANYGKEYGLKNKNNKDALKLINDFDWLKKEYERFYSNTI